MLTTSLPLALYRASQVRELDRIAIQDMGIPGLCLMERAGNSVFEIMQHCWSEARRIIIICGTGNNGGDGYVVARLAYLAGYDVTVLQLGDVNELKNDAQIAYKAMTDVGLSVQVFAEKKLTVVDLIIDAILGTGLNRDVDGECYDVIAAVNRCQCPVLSVDIPSGLHADTGSILGTAIHANVTVSFIGLKQGLFTGEGPDYSGKIYFNDLQVPNTLYKLIKNQTHRLDYQSTQSYLPRRRRTSHKGHFGHVLIIGGESGMTGAVQMAAEAAMRVGAGKVTVATRKAHASFINLHRPEIMSNGVETQEELFQLLSRVNVVAIGPGLGQSIWARTMLNAVKDLQKPVILDADALNLLAQMPYRFVNGILTPHVGEAARLLETTTDQVQADRFTAVKKIQLRFGGVIVLKGAGTLIADQQESVHVCTLGNPGMASGGMGDVLTGVLAGLVAQGLSLKEAACVGTCLHGQAGDRAAQEGERGLLAGDLFQWLRYYANPYLASSKSQKCLL